jgi:outer membrane protein
MKVKGLVSFLILVSSSAQASTLSWEECLKEASQNNADLRAASLNLQSSEYLAKGAWSGFLPQASANLGYTTSGPSSTSSLRAGNSSSDYTASLNATQNLFTGFADKARVDQAKANENISKAQLTTVRARVSFDLKSAFQTLLYAQNYLNLTHEIIRRREQNLRLVELRFENGNENKGSYLLSEAYLADAKFNELQAKDTIRTAQEQLARVLGRDEPEGLVVGGLVPVSQPAPTVDLKQLTVQTPDHLQAVAQEDSAQAGLLSARSPFFPSLNVSGQVGRTGPTFFPDNQQWSASVGISFPFFSGGRDYFNTKSSAALLSSAAANLENVNRQLLVKLGQAFSAFVESVEKLKVDEQYYQAASVRAQIGREKYNNGLLSFEEWDLIENDLIQREKNRLQSQRDRVINEAGWEQALGKGAIP